MNVITQDMRYKRSRMRCIEEFDISRASRKYNRCRPYIYFWQSRYLHTL